MTDAVHGISAHHIDVRRTARYYTIGNPATAPDVWYCLHGYGELAARHIQAFTACADSSRVFVAPEALSRFYTDSTNGRIGASWMTREDREVDISDYIGYLNALRDEVTRPSHKEAREVVSGFSQGTATASRWAAGCERGFDMMILWGGTVAPDIDAAGIERIKRIRRRILVFGDSDQYADEAHIAKAHKLLVDRGIPFELIRFSGGHRVDEATLALLLSDAGGA